VKVGDRVTNAEPDIPTLQQHTVTAVHITGDDTDFDDLTVTTPIGPKTLSATAHHLFWDATTHTWTAAADVKPGDQLDTPYDRHAVVAANHRYTANSRTYNLTIDSVHTYYVVAGRIPVLVHNMIPCPEQLGEIWHEGTWGTAARNFEVHYDKHGVPLGVTPEQYFEDAKDWAERLAQPGGKVGYNAKRTEFEDGEFGVLYRDPKGGRGG